MSKISLTLASLLLITQAGRAQDVKRLSMHDCMEYAIAHNYTVKNAKIDVRIQKAQNNQTLAAAYPQINGKVEITDFLNPQKTFIEARTFSPTAPAGLIVGFPFALNYAGNASVSASQLVFDGQVFIAVKARNTVMELAKNNETVSEDTIRYNVYRAYKSMVIAYRQFDILKASMRVMRSSLHDLEITRREGFAEKIDVDRTTVQLNNLVTDSMRTSSLLLVAEQNLKFNLGMDLNTPIVLTDTVVDDEMGRVMSLLNEQANYEKVPMYNVLNSVLKLNGYNLKRYQLAAYPSLALVGSVGYNYATNKFVDIVTPSNYAFYSLVGIQLNVPIFSGLKRKNQVTEAQLNVEKSKNNIDNMKLGIDFMINASKITLKNAVLTAQNQKRNLDLANEVFDLAQKKYKAGVGSNIEVTQAQGEQLKAQGNYFSALLDVINAEADLKKGLGHMTTNNLN